MYLIYILADRRVGAHSGAQEAPIRTFIENGNLSLTRKFGFDVSVPPSSQTLVQTLRTGIKTQWVREGSLRHVRCVPFWRKINGFRGNQRVKI